MDTAERASGRGPSALPAPYESPWVLLRRALIALLASLGLRGRELWRRNREADLSVPGFWPAGLASWFWPLLLLLALTLLGLLSQAGVRGLHRDSPAQAPPQAAPPAEPAAAPTAALVAEPPGPSAPPPLQLDPLLSLLADQDPERLIRSAHPDPAAATLELELDGRFARLPEPRQRQLASLWLERGEALGYEDLRLLDPGGGLLGRRARVGSGMILFASPTSS